MLIHDIVAAHFHACLRFASGGTTQRALFEGADSTSDASALSDIESAGESEDDASLDLSDWSDDSDSSSSDSDISSSTLMAMALMMNVTLFVVFVMVMRRRQLLGR